MAVRIGARPEHAFDEPLGLLSDCHRRIEHFLAVLQKVREQAGGGPLGDEQRRAVDAALEYFRSAAPRHTADEEESLFPLLRASGREDVRAALETVKALEADHRTADRAHADVERLFVRWVGEGSLAGQDLDVLSDALAGLRELYARHIAVEDRELFPLAGRVLNAEQLARLGAEMAGRRGLAPPAPGR